MQKFTEVSSFSSDGPAILSIIRLLKHMLMDLPPNLLLLDTHQSMQPYLKACRSPKVLRSGSDALLLRGLESAKYACLAAYIMFHASMFDFQ